MTELSELIGRLVCITYQEGNSPITKKGRLISINEDFIELRTFSNTFLIRRSAIIALKAFDVERRGP